MRLSLVMTHSRTLWPEIDQWYLFSIATKIYPIFPEELSIFRKVIEFEISFRIQQKHNDSNTDQ
jgi:hypothetical protein